MRQARIIHFLLACCILPAAQAHAQAVPGERVFTLDETIGILNAAVDGRGVFRWDPFFQEGSFAAGGHHGVFPTALSAGQTGFLMLNSRDIYDVPLPFLEGGQLVFPEEFVATARGAFSRQAREPLQYRVAAIIIDPGHGGRDPGAVAYHTIGGVRRLVRESDIVLEASKMLRDMLVRRYPDKRVLMTRERDVFISLEERASIANSVHVGNNEAVIFVSMHTNAAVNRNARGFEVWHLTRDYRRDVLDEALFPYSPELRNILNMMTEEVFLTESILMARSILGAMDRAVGGTMPNRGIRAENWFVVRRSNMPAVLVELGFVTNREDAVLMTSETGLRRLVEAVYKGIVDYVSAFERSGGFIVTQ